MLGAHVESNLHYCFSFQAGQCPVHCESRYAYARDSVLRLRSLRKTRPWQVSCRSRLVMNAVKCGQYRRDVLHLAHPGLVTDIYISIYIRVCTYVHYRAVLHVIQVGPLLFYLFFYRYWCTLYCTYTDEWYVLSVVYMYMAPTLSALLTPLQTNALGVTQKNETWTSLFVRSSYRYFKNIYPFVYPFLWY